MSQPDSVLRIFLDTSRDIIREPSLQGKLSLIAHAWVRSGLFNRVAVQLYRTSYGEKIFGFAGLSTSEEQWLFAHDNMEQAEYATIREMAIDLGGLYYVRHDRMDEEFAKHLLTSSSTNRGKGWHPEDMIFIPLFSSQQVMMGNITADEPTDGMIPSAYTAQLVAPFVALTAATLEQELTRRHDTLTGLFNSHFLDDRLARRITQHIPTGLVYCDMDGLKSINDNDGHDAGDQAIRQMASALNTVITSWGSARPATAFRLYGDEFVLIFTPRVGETNQDILRSMAAIWPAGAPATSAGVARAKPGDTATTLMRRAELQMYVQKNQKRIKPRRKS